LTASDLDGDPISFQIAAPPAHGRLTRLDPATGAFTYAPNSNFAGADVFTFRANDGLTNSLEATVNITVNPTLPLFTGFEHPGDGRFVLHVLAPPGPAYVIEASIDLTLWLPIATNASPSNPFDFIDSDARGYPRRFYRVRQ
jgi:Bacterial Ig domain